MPCLQNRLSRRQFLESVAAFAVPFQSPLTPLSQPRVLWRYVIPVNKSLSFGPANDKQVVLFQEVSKTTLQMTLLDRKKGTPFFQEKIPAPVGPDAEPYLLMKNRILTRYWQSSQKRPDAPSDERRLDVRDTATGKIVWQAITHWNSPVIAGDEIVVWQNSNNQTRPNATTASEAADGKVRWSLPGDRGTPLAIANGRVYLWAEKIGKYLVTADIKTGQILGDARYNPTESVLYQQPSVIITKDTAVFSETEAGAGVNNFDLRVVTLSDGATRWVADAQAALGLAGSILVCAPVERGKPHLLGRDLLTGKVLWERTSPTEQYMGAAPDEATFWVQPNEDEAAKTPVTHVVQRIRARDGKVVSSFFLPMHEEVVSVTGNTLLTLSQAPSNASYAFVLYAYRLP